MAQKTYNRASQDVGNIASMEHVNIAVPDQAMATLFYVNGLGFTREPYIDFGPVNAWINVGEQQFHLPTNEPQVLRGHVGVVVPNLDELVARLERVGRYFVGTRFACKRLTRRVDVTCPWGNSISCFGPGHQSGMKLGIAYVQFTVPAGTTSGIARFYNEVMCAPAVSKAGICSVSVGKSQQLRFRESKRTIPAYDGHHVAIYVTNFSGPHGRLQARGLVTEESSEHQYRFDDIVDPDSGESLFRIEHEVRSLFHPMYARALTNRNPAQSVFSYVPGRDAFVP